MFTASARPAAAADLPSLESLYRELEDEMVELKPVWRLTDGLAEPISASLERLLDAAGSGLIVGEIAQVPLGFVTWRHSTLLPQAEGRLVGVISLIFTTRPARRVGLGEAMITAFLDMSAARGVEIFDAIVPPGHRDAKNFFESNGFKARQIVMHTDRGGGGGSE